MFINAFIAEKNPCCRLSQTKAMFQTQFRRKIVTKINIPFKKQNIVG
jgi:hypothetical protein